MAQVRSFCLIGDSIVRRHMNRTNCRSNPLMSSCHVITCTRLPLFSEAISSIRNSSNVIVFSCVTNFLADAPKDGATSVSQRVEPVLEQFAQMILDFARSGSDAQVLVAPPMYRTSPIWFREGLPEILKRFSASFDTKPANVHLLPSFASPDLEEDGIHLTAYSGLEFVLHLFDASAVILDALTLGQDAKLARGGESTRLLEDRVMVLEQDHQRLNKVVEVKTASDAEADDFAENVRLEDHFVISGLTRLPSDLDTKTWQNRAKSDVQSVIKTVVGKELPIVVVMNSTGRRPDAIVQYRVRMTSVADSAAIRAKFGSFFSGGVDRRPDALRGVSVRNLVTQGTRVRLAVLQTIAKRYRDANPDGRAYVIGFESRPLLKVSPPSTSSDKRVRSYTYLEAIRKFPTCFTTDEFKSILDKAASINGDLRSLFVIISDDMVEKRLPRVRNKRGPQSPAGSPSRRRHAADEENA